MSHMPLSLMNRLNKTASQALDAVFPKDLFLQIIRPK